MRLASFVILLFLFSFSKSAFAQYKPPSARNSKATMSRGNAFDKFYFGGGGGFSGGTNYLNLSVSPLVGYKVTEEFSAGMQISYQYVKSGDFKISNYGGGPFLRYNVGDRLFGYTQFEYLNFGYPDYFGEIQRLGFESWFVGLGYVEPLGDNFAFNILALYNLLYQSGGNSPYPSPLVFRVGIITGL